MNYLWLIFGCLIFARFSVAAFFAYNDYEMRRNSRAGDILFNLFIILIFGDLLFVFGGLRFLFENSRHIIRKSYFIFGRVVSQFVNHIKRTIDKA